MPVFFLSDYGTQDEFVGVVHAVIAAGAPGTTVVDLTHHIAPFDVAAGSRALVRSVPSCGPGVVLAVVDPGVGTSRRGVVLEVAAPSGQLMWFVGPDNGLLVAAAELVAGGSVLRAVELPAFRPRPGVGATFDGRDLFAPAVAALCRGVELEALGPALNPSELVRLPPDVAECRKGADGQWTVRAAVTWIDAFGNTQLSVRLADLAATGLESDTGVHLGSVEVRLVSSFAELAPAQLGLLADANGHVAIVARQASAADVLHLAVDDVVTLTW